MLLDALRGLSLVMEREERVFGTMIEIFDSNLGQVGRAFIKGFQEAIREAGLRGGEDGAACI